MTATQIKIAKSRLAKLRTLALGSGSHADFEAGVCAMEAVAWLAKEPHSDTPSCACPAIGAFMRNWNDNLPDDATRTRLLAPLLPLIIGTRSTSDKVLVRRSYMAIDWEIRVSAPAWLRLAGLTEHADALAALPEVSCMPALIAARKATAAAWDAARAAAGAAAGDAARAAAWDAAWDAAWAAAGAALAPTVAELQASAQDLVRRMCALTEADVAGWSWDGPTS